MRIGSVRDVSFARKVQPMFGRFWRSNDGGAGSPEAGLAPSEPAIAADALDRLRELAGDDCGAFLIDLFEEFFTTSRDIIDEMAANTRDADLGQLRKSSHTLKGAALNLGANVLAGLCKEGEGAAREQRSPDAAWIPRIEAEFARARVEFETVIKPHLQA